MNEKKFEALRNLAYLYVLMDEMFEGIGFREVEPVRMKFFKIASAVCGIGGLAEFRREIMAYRRAFERMAAEENGDGSKVD